jgi:hypothetical protein
MVSPGKIGKKAAFTLKQMRVACKRIVGYI